MPLDALDVPTVARQYAFEPTLSKRPYPNAGVIASGSEALVIRAEADSPNGFFRRRSSPGFQVVHMRVEVLDNAALVCRYQEGARVVELHRTDGRVVRLKNGFKVER
jgi:hypothetical protein